MDIVSELDIIVKSGRKQLMVGRGELEMMTFNDEHRWVFPLSPTACDYEELDGYFWGMPKSQLEAMQAQGDFGDIWAFGK